MDFYYSVECCAEKHLQFIDKEAFLFERLMIIEPVGPEEDLSS